MSDGINPSELNEAPQRTDQVKEAAEVKTEVQEAAVSLEKASLKPEVKVETERSIEESEEIETAFTELMVSSPEDQSAWNDSPNDDRISSADERDPDRPGPDVASQEPEIKAAAVSEAPSASQAASEDAVDVSTVDAKSNAESDSAPGVEIAGPGGDDGEKADLGLDDIEDSEDNTEVIYGGGEPGSDIRDAERTAAEGQQGEVAAEGINPIEGTEVLDLMGGREGMGPGDLEGGPDIGTDQSGELGDLAAAAGAGPDGRLMEGDDDSGTDSGGSTGDSGDTGSSSSSDTGSSSADLGEYWDGDQWVDVPADAGPARRFSGFFTAKQFRVTAGRVWSTYFDIDGTTEDNPEGNAVAGGIRGYDPEGEIGELGQADRTLGGMIVDAVPELSPLDDQNVQDSLTQPADDESGNRPPVISYDPGSATDPYAQYTGEEGGDYRGPTIELDADGSLVDPPAGVSGGETGNPPPPTDGGPGVNPNLPRSGPAAGGPDTVVDGRIISEPMAKDQKAVNEGEMDPDPVDGEVGKINPEAIGTWPTPESPEAIIDSNDMPDPEASENSSIESIQETIPTDKADPRTEAEKWIDLRQQSEPQPEDFITGYDEDGNPMIDWDAYESAHEQWVIAGIPVGPVVMFDNIGSSGHTVPSEVAEDVSDIQEKINALEELLNSWDNQIEILAASIEESFHDDNQSDGGHETMIITYSELIVNPNGSFTVNTVGGNLTESEAQTKLSKMQQDRVYITNAIQRAQQDLNNLLSEYLA